MLFLARGYGYQKKCSTQVTYRSAKATESVQWKQLSGNQSIRKFLAGICVCFSRNRFPSAFETIQNLIGPRWTPSEAGPRNMGPGWGIKTRVKGLFDDFSFLPKLNFRSELVPEQQTWNYSLEVSLSIAFCCPLLWIHACLHALAPFYPTALNPSPANYSYP